MKPLAIFASLVAFAGTAFAQDESPTIQVFSKDSFWYKPIPADAPLHENSENFVKEFLRQKKAYYGTVAINTKEYASPVYIVDKKVPKIDVGFNDPRQKAGYVWPALVEQWKDVPLPAYAEPADGTDQELTLYQPSTDTIWEFWLMRKVEGKWVAAWGGKMEKASKNDGIFPDRLGTTATSLPFLGGQITAAEMKAQRIDHVMGIALVDLEHFSVVSWPASRSDGYNPEKAPNRIPEGLRFRLDPSVDVEALQMHPIGKAIARAAQKYGFVIWDKAGAITLRAENPKGYTLTERPDPYPELFGGTPQYSILNGFPWDKLQFLPMNYGKPRR